MELETKQKILEAARRLFSEKGFTAVRTKEIAEAAGVNEVTLFRKFGNKRTIYHETFKEYIVRPTPEYLLGGTVGNPEADLEIICTSIVRLFNQNSSLIQMSYKAVSVFEEIAGELHSQPEQMIGIMADYFSGIVKSRGIDKTPERLARYFVTSIFSASFHFIHHPEIEKDYKIKEYISDFISNFLAGLECG